ncbi:MAG: Rieske 2Fe-2S domain-containing protein [Acidimicrobiia bacterium]
MAIALAASIVGSLAAVVVYALGGAPHLEGVFIGLALGGLGVGLILWAKSFLPEGGEVQERENLAPGAKEESAAEESLQRGVRELDRRGFLVRVAAGAVGALGLAAVFPIRSLGARPGDVLIDTPWSDGVRAVDSSGNPIAATDVEIGQVTTVYPEGHLQAADAITLLIGLPPGTDVPVPGRESWSVDGIVAYSKICTHVGCPVGLYEPTTQQLFCPCHQSVFQVSNGARPTGGPATRALPQLPLGVDDNGCIVARGGFSEAPGPGFWSRPLGDR